ncbi:uncharacterized protein LOC144422864 [Styela clava]
MSETTCCIHYHDCDDGLLTEISIKSCKRIWYSSLAWKDLECEVDKEIAINILKLDEDILKTKQCHKKCYSKFTNITRINRARSKKKPIDTENRSELGIKPKRTSSEIFADIGNKFARRNKNVLSKKCIICRKEKFIKRHKAHSREKLSCCEYSSGGLFYEAALARNDESVLVQIRNRDLVAIEVRYHPSCYKEYIKILTIKPISSSNINNENVYTKHFENFCTSVVNSIIIENGNPITLIKLKQLFVEFVAKDGLYIDSDLQTSYFKQKLKTCLPALLFLRPSMRRKSEIVYSPESKKLIAEYLESLEINGNDYHYDETSQVDFISEVKRDMYRSAIFLKNVIKNYEGCEKTWPPTSSDFELPWMVGASEDISNEGFLNVSEFYNIRLVSLAQDVIYLASRGRKQTPKHLALGMTVRHWTGSSRLIELLHGLGHSASHSVVLEHDTALTELQLQKHTIVPDGFLPRIPSTIVWDNNDFNEETKSGEGTTHNTNGILIQVRETVVASQSREKLAKSKRRSVPTRSEFITPYRGSKTSEPAKISKEIMYSTACSTITSKYLNIDLAYVLLKLPEVSKTVVPGWTAFNTILNKSAARVSNIGYLPVIDAPSTDISTINTVLEKSVAIADELDLHSVVVVFDQAIYAKAQKIRWSNPLFYKRLVLRLGEFHTCMSFLSVIGKRYESSGLSDILIESRVVAPGSINSIMHGRHYNRSIRAHKLVFEALHRMRWNVFIKNQSLQSKAKVFDLASKLNNAYTDPQLFKQICESKEVRSLMVDYQLFIEHQSKMNKTFSLWSSYIDMVELLLQFIRATRDGLWDLHLATLHKMLPWFFAYDHINYARYVSVYLSEMENLSSSHPEIYQYLKQGNFSVQRHAQYGFSQIACDQLIEQTLNRDSKTRGGIRGLSLNKNAVNRWLLSHHQRALISMACREMAGKDSTRRQRKDLDSANSIRDEQNVQSIVDTVTFMTDPFDLECDSLMNLSSGSVASDAIKMDMEDAFRLGKNNADLFCQNRILANSTVSIFTPIKQLKLKTFASGSAKINEKVPHFSKKSEDNFYRLLLIGKSKNIELQEMLEYPLTAIPASIGSPNGTPVRTNKARLLHELENSVPEVLVKSYPLNAALVIDGMALLQSLNNIPETFGRLLNMIFDRIINMAKSYNCNRVDFVCDTYPDISIKNFERCRRSSNESEIIKIVGLEQKTPKQFKKFLFSGKNKEALVEFLISFAPNYQPSCSVGKMKIFIGHGAECHCINFRQFQLCVSGEPSLVNDHEEADTKLLLHAKHCSSEFNDVIINSPDTDVLILSLAHSSDIGCNLYFLTGSGSQSRMLSIRKMVNYFGNVFCKAILGLHVFSGCDTISAFRGKGKVKGMRHLLKSKEFIQAFSKLGDQWYIPENIYIQLSKFVCTLYGYSDEMSVNKVRFEIFQNKSLDEPCMPPSDDAIVLHSARANYQCAIHRRALQNFISAPNPDDHGWIVNDSNINIKWISKQIAPNSVLNHSKCRCAKLNCKSSKCPCVKSGFSCSSLCSCNDCSNADVIREEDDDINIEIWF